LFVTGGGGGGGNLHKWNGKCVRKISRPKKLCCWVCLLIGMM